MKQAVSSLNCIVISLIDPLFISLYHIQYIVLKRMVNKVSAFSSSVNQLEIEYILVYFWLIDFLRRKMFMTLSNNPLTFSFLKFPL